MIEIFIVALLVFFLAMTGMAVGLFAGRHEMAKGCMTLGTARNEASVCRVCGRPAGGDGCTEAASQTQSEESST